MSSNLEIRRAKTKEDYARCIQIRTQVFVIDQGVPADREVDTNENDSIHILVLKDSQAIGAGRWRISDQDTAKIERMAILESARGQKIGAQMLEFILEDIKQSEKAQKIILGSQDHAIPFYERYGFTVFGEGYMDGGTIPHHDMVLNLNQA